MAHDREGTNRDLDPDRGLWGDASVLRHTGSRPPHGVHPVEDLGQGHVWIGGDQKIPPFDPGIGADQNRTRKGLVKERPIARIREKGQIVRARLFECGYTVNPPVGVAVDTIALFSWKSSR